MAKKSRLDDDSELYSKRNEQTERQKLKDMTIPEKLEYFQDYYLKAVIVGIVALSFIIWTLVSAFSKKPDNVLYAAIVNDYISQQQIDTLSNDFIEFLELDPKNTKVSLDNSYQLSKDLNMAYQTKLSTYIGAGEVDIIIADEKVFSEYAKYGNFVNLMEYLPTDLYSKFSNAYYMSSTTEDKKKKPYGVYLSDSVTYKSGGSTLENPILGIVINSKNKDNACEFLRFLF